MQCKEIDKKLFQVIILLISLLIIPSVLFGVEADIKPEGKPEDKIDFVLTINEGLISLSAEDASLKDVVEEIGRRMNIEVVANVSEEEKITIELRRLSIRDAIERLSRNYVYLIDSEKEGGKITKIMLLPKGTGIVIPTPSTKEIKKSVAKPESKAGKESLRETFPEPKKADKEKTSQPEPFKFEFNP